MSAHGNGHYPIDERQRDRRARMELHGANGALRAGEAYARRVLRELAGATSGHEREARLIQALQHIQAHCHSACAAITLNEESDL
ncbi:MAG: hypothetical protein M3376_06415 [Actinomycetota bacterium]|nr:hypothetical protein [Actinomycetota bacterium]